MDKDIYCHIHCDKNKSWRELEFSFDSDSSYGFHMPQEKRNDQKMECYFIWIPQRGRLHTNQ